ncbi:hypothetical protein T01_2923 [Trichinella spiralis]|uniref:Uncharacterized protein n=1 Tax=Trichinella spiralis TaxID=6334 RepID=A0A0V1BL45_TRISP|nr:hypothetical protein T01_2923 [Trichinella spiralis]
MERLLTSKNNHFMEFYAVHDLNYSLRISMIPRMLLFDSVLALFVIMKGAYANDCLYYKNEFQVQMLLRSRTLLGEYKSVRIYFLIPLLPLKSHHHSTFFAISQQIRVYTTCDQKVLESSTANKPVRVE